MTSFFINKKHSQLINLFVLFYFFVTCLKLYFKLKTGHTTQYLNTKNNVVLKIHNKYLHQHLKNK